MSEPTKRRISERLLVFLIGAVQFVNILDFVMVMPLGPDFAQKLHIPLSRLGFVGGSYALSAAFAGLLGSVFLDRFDRRSALAVALVGLSLGTFAGGLSTGFASLLAARVLAGFFGGPATSLSMSIIADGIPAERRGKALGAVLGAFSVASVLGIPASLKLAEWFGWRAPFLVVATMSLLITAGTITLLPPMRDHLKASRGGVSAPPLPLLRRTVLQSYAMTAVAMGAGFLLIPNLSAYYQRNLGLPRTVLPWLYGVGGVVSFVTLRVVGRLVDRFGSFRVGSVGSLLMLGAIWTTFVGIRQPSPVPSLFVLFLFFMLSLQVRNVAYNTLTSKVPEVQERARFMSFQSTVQHLASSAGAITSSLVLAEGMDGHLLHVRRLAALSMALVAAFPPLLWLVERAVGRRSGPPVAALSDIGPVPVGMARPLKKV